MNTTSPQPVLLQFDRAGYRIGGHNILSDISLQCLPGSVTALVGPNGAGKSTLLALMAGDIAPSSGRALLCGRDISTWRARPLARMRCVLPQDHAVRFAFSVREVVAMGRLPHPSDPATDAAIVEQEMVVADIADLAERDVRRLSGGEAARAAFARILAQRTPLLLLDEPTAALDLHHQERVMQILRTRSIAGACVVIVLHDLNLAAGYADRIVMLADGQLVAHGNPAEVLTANLIRRVYRQQVEVIAHPSRDVPLVVIT